MPSSYSSSLRLELQASGENANTWGTKTNNNLNLIEQAISGYTKITLASASATYNLTIADASASEGRNAFIEFAGTVASAISIVVPDAEKGYWVRNSATGSPLTFRTSSGTGLTLPTNEWVFLIADGTSVVSTLPTSLTNYARLAAANTFTNANTFTSAVTLQGPVSVVGATTFTSAVTFSGATSLASTLFVNGTATFNGVVSVSGTLYPKLIIGTSAVFTDKLDVGGRLDVATNAAVGGSLNVGSTFTASGAAFLASAVTISGPTSIANTLRVQSTATFDSNVSVSGSLGVIGAATFSSAVSINTLTVSNNTTLNGNVSVSGSFVVSGVATFTSSVNLLGPTSANSTIYVAGTATFNSNVSANANLRVVGSANFSTGHFTNSVRMSSDLSVVSTATFGRSIHVASAIFCSVSIGILEFSGNNSVFRVGERVDIGVQKTVAGNALINFNSGTVTSAVNASIILDTAGKLRLQSSGGPVQLKSGLNIMSDDNINVSYNILIGTSSYSAGSTGTIVIANGTAPTTNVVDSVILYAQDVAASSELKVRDEAGNITTLSPHNFSLCGGPSEEMAWSYYSEKDGKAINIDMMKLARLLEKLTGEKLVYIGDAP